MNINDLLTSDKCFFCNEKLQLIIEYVTLCTNYDNCNSFYRKTEYSSIEFNNSNYRICIFIDNFCIFDKINCEKFYYEQKFPDFDSIEDLNLKVDSLYKNHLLLL